MRCGFIIELSRRAGNCALFAASQVALQFRAQYIIPAEEQFTDFCFRVSGNVECEQFDLFHNRRSTLLRASYKVSAPLKLDQKFDGQGQTVSSGIDDSAISSLSVHVSSSSTPLRLDWNGGGNWTLDTAMWKKWLGSGLIWK